MSPEGAAECVSCGVIFAKLKAIQERERAQAEDAIAQSAVTGAKGGPIAPSGPVFDLKGQDNSGNISDPLLGRKIGAAIAIAWILGFAIYYRHAVSAARARALKTPVKERATVLLRDPVTGELKAVPVTVPASRKDR